MSGFSIWNNNQLSTHPFCFALAPRFYMTSANLIVTEQFAFLQSSLEKAAFVRLYLVSQGRFPLMGLMEILSAAIQHQEKDTLAWMVLQSLYQARIASHANTGEAGLGNQQDQKDLPSLLTCNCFLH